MEIRNINIRNVDVRDIRTSYWMTQEPSVPYAPPVTVHIGVPVIDIPGCVEAHEQNTNRENGILNEDDPSKLLFVMLVCRHLIPLILMRK